MRGEDIKNEELSGSLFQQSTKSLQLLHFKNPTLTNVEKSWERCFVGEVINSLSISVLERLAPRQKLPSAVKYEAWNKVKTTNSIMQLVVKTQNVELELKYKLQKEESSKANSFDFLSRHPLSNTVNYDLETILMA